MNFKKLFPSYFFPLVFIFYPDYIFASDFEESITPFYKNEFFWKLFLIVFLIIFILFAIIIAWNYNLKLAVEIRTRALERKRQGLKAEVKAKHRYVEMLHERESHLRSVLETLPDLIWLKDLRGRYINCNARFTKLFGVSEADIKGETDHEFLKQEKADMVAREDREVILSEKSIITEEKVRFADDGHKAFLEIVRTPMYDLNSKLIGVLGIARDITARKGLEKELINKNLKLESLLSNIQGITYRCLLDEHFTMIYMSNYTEKLTGYKPSDFINNSRQTFESIIFRDDITHVLTEIDKAVKKGEAWEIEYRLVHKNGNIIWVFEKGSAVSGKRQKVECLDGFIVNITDRKIMEEHFSQSQKMEAIGSLAGGIAHDFNNILSGILGFTELLRDDLKDMESGDKIRQKVNYILEGGMRAKDLISQILAFSRSDEKRTEPVYIGGIVKEVTKLLKVAFPANIRIEQIFECKSLVFGDASKIHQVLMNLCTNSGYAMKDSGGVLVILVKEKTITEEDSEKTGVIPGEYVVLSIQDNGCGIPKDLVDKIMDPFFTTKPKGIGTGMGLWVVQGIIEEMNGSIRLKSEIGTGTRFDLYIPVYKKKEKQVSPSMIPEIKGGKEKILFVDDEESLIRLADASLTELGYNVTAFQNGIKALEHFQENLDFYDIIITDMNMPEITGENLCIKAKQMNKDIKVILNTGTFDQSKQKEYLELFDDILKKPVLIHEMAAAVRKVIDGEKSGFIENGNNN